MSNRKTPWLGLKHQRGSDGLLTPLALALNALEEHGCDCNDDAPGTCLACRCETALRHIHDKLSDVPVDGYHHLTVREACRCRHPLDGADAQALEHALTITERERDALATAARSAADPTRIKWGKDGRESFAWEDSDLLLTVTRIESADPLVRFRCSVFWQSNATLKKPVFRVSAESAEMGKHALQTWLDRHGPNFRRQTL